MRVRSFWFAPKRESIRRALLKSSMRPLKRFPFPSILCGCQCTHTTFRLTAYVNFSNSKQIICCGRNNETVIKATNPPQVPRAFECQLGKGQKLNSRLTTGTGFCCLFAGLQHSQSLLRLVDPQSDPSVRVSVCQNGKS